MSTKLLTKLADDMEKEEGGFPPKKKEEERKAPEAPKEEEVPEQEEEEAPAAAPAVAVNPAAVMDFFAQPGPIDDAAFHAFCEQNGFDVSQAEAIAYKLAQKCMGLLRGGASAGVDPNQFDPEQIDMGMQVEAEHTDCPVIQKKITFDHLAEDPQYYSSEFMQQHIQQEQGAEEQPPVDPMQQPITEKTAELLRKVAGFPMHVKKNMKKMGIMEKWS